MNASCSSAANPLKSFISQFQVNRPFKEKVSSPSAKQLNGLKGQDNNLVQEFLRPVNFPDTERFPLKGHPLRDQIANNATRAIVQNNWANDFYTSQQQFEKLQLTNVEKENFEAVFNANKSAPFPQSGENWNSEFFNDEYDANNAGAIDKLFEEIFEDPQEGSWFEDFQQMENNENWTAEFEEIERSEGNVTGSAAQLYESMKAIGNEKLQQSEFMQFVEKLKNKEIVIEGKEVVENSPAIKNNLSPDNMVKEFQEFHSKQPVLPNEFEDTWNNHKGMEEKDDRAIGIANFLNDFNKTFDVQSGGIWSQEEALHFERKWAESIPDNNVPLLEKKVDPFQRWVNQYKKNIESLSQEQQDMEWKFSRKHWEEQNNSFGYRLTDPRYNHYTFERINPYTTTGITHLGFPGNEQSLSEAILILEAMVQLDPKKAEAWKRLGELQQENENEVAAISALRTAVNLQPEQLDSWVLLAVSYTNENCREDAFDAMETWLRSHPVYHSHYSQITFQHPNRHSYLTSLYLDLARSNPGEKLDPDVQTILGILFNISEEYEKAADCFSSALTRKPKDHQLWNRLGATLTFLRQPTKALEAYFSALHIKPTYIRARYNCAVSCIDLGQLQEAAEHLCSALSSQTALGTSATKQDNKLPSNRLWELLKTTFRLMKQPHLIELCDNKDLGAIKAALNF